MNDDSREILFNDAALNALKRHQLQSLTKKHGLKSNGKNLDMIQRLQDFAAALTPGRPLYLPPPAATPGPGQALPACSETSSPLASHAECQVNGNIGHVRNSMASDQWEVLSDSEASIISPSKYKEGQMDSLRSWKSSGNGAKLDEFGGNADKMVQSGSMNSIKSMASSLKRSASQHLLSRSRRGSLNLLDTATAPVEKHQPMEVDEEIEQMAEPDPPSPASTVGVPRRYSGLSLLERPSTVRLVASPPPGEDEEDGGDAAHALPFLGSAKNIHSLKERRSMAPLRSVEGSLITAPLARKSMPAISASTSASVSNIYPPMPPLPIAFQKLRDELPPAMPGALPSSPAPAETFVFGSSRNAVSDKEFSDAGKAILAQMNAKLPQGFSFSEEYLKGKQAGVDRLVRTNSTLGEGGWGLCGRVEPKVDRYADAHQKEFAKMRSISKQNLPTLTSSTSTKAASTVTVNAGSTPAKRKRSSVHLPSAPNGAPLGVEAEQKGPEAKRKRMSYLGGLKDAGRSLLNLMDDPTPLERKVAENMEKKRQSRRRSSLMPGGLKSRFGWLGRKKKSLGPMTRPVPRSHIPAPTLPRKTSVYAPRDPPQPKPKFDLQASLSRSQSTNRGLSSSTSTQIRPKQRKASSSAQTVMSTSTARSRSKIPDFAPIGTNGAATSSVNTLGLPKPSSSIKSSLRKQSQAEILKNARPAPAPHNEMIRPKVTAAVPSSRLYAPTASSLARMQATVKPEGPRPLPAVPVKKTSNIPTAEPFGTASTRDNVLFQTNFNVPKPVPTPLPSALKKGNSMSQLKSPLKSAASSRARAQASGINAVKSRPDLRKEREVHARRAEIKARQGRMDEERELRKMLAGDDIVIPDA